MYRFITCLSVIFYSSVSSATNWHEFIVCEDNGRSVVDQGVEATPSGSYRAVYQVVIRNPELVNNILKTQTTLRANPKGEFIVQFFDPSLFSVSSSLVAGYVLGHGDDYLVEFDLSQVPSATLGLFRVKGPNILTRDYLGEWRLDNCAFLGSRCAEFHGRGGACTALSDCAYDHELQVCRGPFNFGRLR